MRTLYSYQDYLDLLDATGRIFDLLDDAYMPGKGIDPLIAQLEDMALQDGVVLFGKDEWDPKDYFELIFEEYGL